jgi:hypothetical protein
MSSPMSEETRMALNSVAIQITNEKPEPEEVEETLEISEEV